MKLRDKCCYLASIMLRCFSFIQASVLSETPIQELGEAETEQITSVIFGLLRQNSFTFLEVLEGARLVPKAGISGLIYD